MRHDFAVIGAGIVGLATAWQLLRRHPGASLVLIEKESAPALHQSGRNSGVIHAGVYYTPGSLKARLCREGAAATLQFCAEQGIAVDRCGKLVVATRQCELSRLQALGERCRINGIECEGIDGAELRRREPRVSGLAALHVPASAVVDYRLVCTTLSTLIRASGGEILFDHEVRTIEESFAEVVLQAGSREVHASWLLACAGLQSDRIARLAGLPTDIRIVPFRGEYYRLDPQLDQIVQHLIYPVPDPALPFLGVHLTRTIDGGVTVGPNAVVGLSREGYARSAFNLRDAADMLSYPGFWRFARRHARHGLKELGNSWSRRAYLAEVQRYCPDIRLQDLQPHPPGIRAQALRRDGSAVEDFLVLEGPRSLHVCNAPSPAATSALPIGAELCQRIEARLAR